MEYKAIDLGLPSGLKWADMNVGASKPEEYGKYFAWGDVKGIEFIWKDVKSGYVKNGDKIGNFQPLTKGEDTVYVEVGISGLVGIGKSIYEQASRSSTILGSVKKNDNDTISFGMHDFVGIFSDSWYNTLPAHDLTTNITPESGYDAARVNMKGNWRLPTKTECLELLDNTIHTIERINGVSGIKFASRISGNSNFIFIPFAGSGHDNSLQFEWGGLGFWTSSIVNSNTQRAWGLYDSLMSTVIFKNNRYIGYSVRGVCE